MKKGTVGAAGSSNPDDYNPDLIKEKIEAAHRTARGKRRRRRGVRAAGFPGVCAWVTFVERAALR